MSIFEILLFCAWLHKKCIVYGLIFDKKKNRLGIFCIGRLLLHNIAVQDKGEMIIFSQAWD